MPEISAAIPPAKSHAPEEEVSLFHTGRIGPRQPGDPCPLSFPQQRLWFLDQLQPGSSTYNIPYAFRIRGDLNVPALQKALNALVERHHVLRTMFASVNGDPLPVVANEWNLELRQIDLRSLPPDQRDRKREELLLDFAARPFDFARDLMLRAMLIRVSDQEYWFVHVSHHIAWEYWSTTILYRDLGPLYEQFAAGRPARLPELAVQYADFALWQRRFLSGPILEKLISYWRNELAGAPAAIRLPIDKPRPPVHTLRGARLPISLDGDTLTAAKALSLQSGVTPFMSLCAAFNVLLYCCTAQTDICIGSPVSRPKRAETENLIGFFVNTLVLRTRLDGKLSFRQLMARISRCVLGAILHGDLPFDKLVEAVKPPRDLSRMPLFQVNFRVQREPLAALQMHGLIADPPGWIDNGTTKFDMSLEIVATGGAEGFFEYSTDLFERSTIETFVTDFKSLLHELISLPDSPLDSVPAVRAVQSHYRSGISLRGPRALTPRWK
ncbi:MAG TPA: condensation domain-containing protein [Chthonomonadales bacterium]|nr:condensation domain-containing protein [Chthonomonadales bacterium]